MKFLKLLLVLASVNSMVKLKKAFVVAWALWAGVSQAGIPGEMGLNKVTPLDSFLKPLFSAEGAEAGLKGCLNRGLYVNGPHTLITKVSINNSNPYWETSYHDTILTEHQFDVLTKSDGGVSEVDVTRTTTRSSRGSTSTGVVPYVLEGYQLRIVGLTRSMPNPNAYVHHFDIEEGLDIPQTLNLGTEASPRYFTRVDTYMGREEVDLTAVDARGIKACRVDSLVTTDADLPQFRRHSLISTWYALGTGLELKVESITYPDSEQDTLLETKLLDTAQLNGVKLF